MQQVKRRVERPRQLQAVAHGGLEQSLKSVGTRIVLIVIMAHLNTRYGGPRRPRSVGPTRMRMSAAIAPVCEHDDRVQIHLQYFGTRVEQL